MRKRRRHRIIRILLPFLFVFYWGSITLFTHFHIVNGVVIVHSHPFKSGHTHSEDEYETIFNLSSFINTPIHNVTFLSSAYWTLLVVFIPFITYTCQKSVCNKATTRAPPYILS